MLNIIKGDLFPLARQMADGALKSNPKSTKNPLRGFFNLDERLVTAMTEVAGLYWGGCEFGGGASGDSMHFDTGLIPDDALGQVSSLKNGEIEKKENDE